MITLDQLLYVSHEIYENVLGNARQFHFNKFVLVSCAVGNMKDQTVMRFCAAFSKPTSYRDAHDGHYNTWYFNSGDHDFDSLDARTLFHYFPVKHNPIYYWSTKPFESIRDQLPLMIETAEKYGYLAMGCDGNKHRGPSVFAMFLCLAGNTPKDATKIANHIFGKNFVLPFVRERIARLGFNLGNENPQLRERLQILMGVKPQEKSA